jgi:transposase
VAERKADANDALGIAHIMRTGGFKFAHMKCESSYRLRLRWKKRRNGKRKFLNVESSIRRSLKVSRVRELLEYSDPIFSVMIEAMLDVRRPIFEGYERLDERL